MAEFRSRNNRVKKVTNTTQQRQYREASAIDWNSPSHLRHQGSQMLGKTGREFVKTDNPLEYQGKTYDYVNSLTLTRRDGNNRSQEILETLAPGEVYGQKYADGKGGFSSFDTVRSKMKTGTHSFSSTSWTAKDGRDGASSDDVDKASTINRKKKGRSGLRIALKGDASDGRLKGNKGQVKKKAGAQGGGKSGLNVPR
jgi:hypothetical protein